MPRQLTKPIMIDESGHQQTLVRLEFADRGYDEAWLQKLLFDHADLVPIGELEPVFGDHVAVCRELPTPAGPVDLVYVNSSGFITLVETKLWRNPDARRSVVAQIIDYTKELARWTYDDLVDAVQRANGDCSKDPFAALFEEHEEFAEADFVDSVTRNLQLGRFLLLIVGDGIREGIEHMVDYLQETPQLHFSLGLVEMGVYRVGATDKGSLLIQPRILARTQEVTRAVVEIRTEVRREDIDVSLPGESRSRPATGRKSLTEDLFFEELEKRGEPRAVQVARWVLDSADNYGLDIVWGDGGPLLKWIDDQTGEFFTFGQLDKNGNLGNTGRLWSRCKKLGLPVDIAQRYFDEVSELIPGAVRKEFHSPKMGGRQMLVMGVDGKPGDRPPLAPLVEHKEQWFQLIQRTAEQLEEALGEKA